MNLVEAFELLSGRLEESPQEQRQLAQGRLYDEIRDIGEKLKHHFGDQYDDVIQDTFLKINRNTRGLKNNSEEGARGLIKMALKNCFRDRCRKEKTRPDLLLDDNEGKERVRFEEELQAPGLEEGAIVKEALKDSEIVDAPESPVEFRKQLCDYLRDVVIPLVVRREPYQSKARDSVEQMRRLSEGDCTWEQLVDEEVAKDATQKKRANGRNRIQKQHSRNRNRLREALENADTDANYEVLSRLSDFDRRLLTNAIRELRQRRRSEVQ